MSLPFAHVLAEKADLLNVTQMGIRFPPEAVKLEMAGLEIQI